MGAGRAVAATALVALMIGRWTAPTGPVTGSATGAGTASAAVSIVVADPQTTVISMPGIATDPSPACSQPTDEQAVAAARSLLTALAVDLTGTTASASSQSGDTVVRFDRSPDGVGGRTVDYGVSGTIEANGVLTPMTDLGSYPVTSPAAAVARLGSTAYDAAQESGSTQGSHSVSPSPSPGTPVRLPAQRSTSSAPSWRCGPTSWPTAARRCSRPTAPRPPTGTSGR